MVETDSLNAELDAAVEADDVRELSKLYHQMIMLSPPENPLKQQAGRTKPLSAEEASRIYREFMEGN